MSIRKLDPARALGQLVNRMEKNNQKPCKILSERFSKKIVQLRHNLFAAALGVANIAKDIIVLAGVTLVAPVKLEILIVRAILPGALQDVHQRFERMPGPVDQIAHILVDILSVAASTAGVALFLFKGADWNVAMQKSLFEVPGPKKRLPQSSLKAPKAQKPYKPTLPANASSPAKALSGKTAAPQPPKPAHAQAKKSQASQLATKIAAPQPAKASLAQINVPPASHLAMKTTAPTKAGTPIEQKGVVQASMPPESLGEAKTSTPLPAKAAPEQANMPRENQSEAKKATPQLIKTIPMQTGDERAGLPPESQLETKNKDPQKTSVQADVVLENTTLASQIATHASAVQLSRLPSLAKPSAWVAAPSALGAQAQSVSLQPPILEKPSVYQSEFKLLSGQTINLPSLEMPLAPPPVQYLEAEEPVRGQTDSGAGVKPPPPPPRSKPAPKLIPGFNGSLPAANIELAVSTTTRGLQETPAEPNSTQRPPPPPPRTVSQGSTAGALSYGTASASFEGAAASMHHSMAVSDGHFPARSQTLLQAIREEGGKTRMNVSPERKNNKGAGQPMSERRKALAQRRRSIEDSPPPSPSSPFTPEKENDNAGVNQPVSVISPAPKLPRKFSAAKQLTFEDQPNDQAAPKPPRGFTADDLANRKTQLQKPSEARSSLQDSQKSTSSFLADVISSKASHIPQENDAPPWSP